MKKARKSQSPATGLGKVFVAVFVLLCALPLVYMVLMSLTQSESPYFRLRDISFDFANYKTILIRNNYTQAIINSSIVARCWPACGPASCPRWPDTASRKSPFPIRS